MRLRQVTGWTIRILDGGWVIFKSSGTLGKVLTIRFTVVRQAFQLALQMAGADATTTLFLDDSTRNIAAAKKVGIFSILVGFLAPSLGLSVIALRVFCLINETEMRQNVLPVTA